MSLERELLAVGRRIRTVLDAGGSAMRRFAVLALVIAGAVVRSPFTAQACSVCGGSALGTDLGAGFNSSILFLLMMPYAVVGAIAGWLIYAYWRASGHRQKRTVVPYVAPRQKESES